MSVPSSGRRLTRRGLLTGSTALAGAALLAGCSSSPTAGKSKKAAASTRFPVTVPGSPSSVTVKSAPQRVVSVGYLRDTDLAIALGAPLVGAVKNPVFASGLAPWQKVGDDVTLLDAGDGMPLEKIAGLKPDLILAADDYTLAKDYASLSKIAPTLCYDKGVGKDAWTAMTTRAGQALGKSDEAAALIARTKQKITDAAAAHPQFRGKTFTSGPITGVDGIYTTNSETDASAAFFQQLGFKLSPRVLSLPPTSTPGRAKISLEEIGELNADVMLVTYSTAAAKKAITSNPLFRKIPAVRRGSCITLDLPMAMSFGFPSVLSIPYGLTSILDRLAKAVAADEK